MSAPERIQADLATIVEQARWAYGYGLSKAGRGLDATPGADLSRSEAERLAGPTWDIEIGHYRARRAFQIACKVVRRVDVILAVILAEEGVAQPPLTLVTHHSRPSELERCAANAAWRAGRIRGEHPRQLRHVREHLDKALAALGKALQYGAPTVDERLCVTCGVRPQAQRPSNHECSTCAAWRTRKGEARPRERDSEQLSSIGAARLAKARRMARGQGWGYG